MFSSALYLLVLVLTGFAFWQPWFAEYFPIPVRRVAVVLHVAFSAVVLILAIVVHVYAAIWIEGSVHAMTRGWVTAGWARRHHALWLREVAQVDEVPPARSGR
ncbi:MAG: hypothetical protein U1F67_18965 [Rubrivivax sp.]